MAAEVIERQLEVPPEDQDAINSFSLETLRLAEDYSKALNDVASGAQPPGVLPESLRRFRNSKIRLLCAIFGSHTLAEARILSSTEGPQYRKARKAIKLLLAHRVSCSEASDVAVIDEQLVGLGAGLQLVELLARDLPSADRSRRRQIKRELQCVLVAMRRHTGERVGGRKMLHPPQQKSSALSAVIAKLGLRIIEARIFTPISATLRACRRIVIGYSTRALTRKAVTLQDGHHYDLAFLCKNGFVVARGRGEFISSIVCEIESRVDREFVVAINQGDFFISTGKHQNMAVVVGCGFTLPPLSRQRVRLEAACLNAEAPIPGKSDRFKGIGRVSAEIATFLEASSGADWGTIQAGVWTLTDNYTAKDIQGRLIRRDRYGKRQPAIGNEQIAAARRTLVRLGIRNRL
jgi:hypothetical protein